MSVNGEIQRNNSDETWIVGAGGLSARIAPAPYIDRYQRRLGNALDPQAVYTALAQADYGYLYYQADMLDEVRETDGHLQSVLARREAMVAGAEWELRPPEDSGPEGTAIAKFCTRALNRIEASDDYGTALSGGIAHMQGGLFHGRSVLEAIWSEDGRSVKTLEPVHARRLAYATDWRLHLWDYAGSATDDAGTGEGSVFTKFPGVPLARFPRGKFLVHRPRIRGGYPQREGLGRTCVWYSCFKKWGIRDLMALAAWCGRGLRIGKYKSGRNAKDEMLASSEDIEILKQALDAMSSAVSIVIPDTTELNIEKAADDPKVHEAIVRIMNAELSKIVLGATLTTEVGQSGGNRALGETQKEGEIDLARSDAKEIASTVKRDLLRPLVARNFSPEAAFAFTPEMYFAVDPAADLDRLSERIERFVKCGGELGQRDARNLLQFPDPQEGDRLLVKP